MVNGGVTRYCKIIKILENKMAIHSLKKVPNNFFLKIPHWMLGNLN
jgi:hypothetical protein